MGLTTTKEWRWDAPGAHTLTGAVGSARILLRDFLLECGWSVIWEDAGAQKVVLRNSQAHGGSGCYVRILDDGSFTGGARVARIDVYRTMSDIDTGTDTVGGGFFWKARTTGVTASTYVLTGDSRTVYMSCYVGGAPAPVLIGNDAGYNTWCGFFGDYDPYIAGDDGIGMALPSVENPGTAPSNEVNSNILNSQSEVFYAHNGLNFKIGRDKDLWWNPVGVSIASYAGPLGLGPGIGGSALRHPPRRPDMYYIPAIIGGEGYARGRLRGLFCPLNDHVSQAGSGVGAILTPFNTSKALSLTTLAGITSPVNSALWSGRLFVERVMSWDDV